MAMKARYTVVNGRVYRENRNGTQRRYVSDALGSTVALLDSTQTITDTYTYWPYGEEKSHTGTSTTPLRYVGGLGYYRDAAKRIYVRARVLRPDQARWLTRDPLWPSEPPYAYSTNSPTSFCDPTGLWAWRWNGCSEEEKRAIRDAIPFPDDPSLQVFLSCLDGCYPTIANETDTIGSTLRNWISASEATFEISCLDPGAIDFWFFANPCNRKDLCAYTHPRRVPPRIHICRRAFKTDACGSLTCLILHELIHATGAHHVGDPEKGTDNAWVFLCLNKIQGCEGWGALGPGHKYGETFG